MRPATNLALFLPLVVSATSILESIDILQKGSTSLSTSLDNWFGSRDQAVFILVGYSMMGKNISDAVEAAKQSAPLSTDDAGPVSSAVANLTSTMIHMVDATTAHAQAFDTVDLAAGILYDLKFARNATDVLGQAVAEKSPVDTQNATTEQFGQVREHFDQAVDAYSVYYTGS